MKIDELEEKRGRLADLLSGSSSPRLKLFLLTDFVAELIKIGNKNLLEVYIAEFFDEYIALLKIYDPTGIKPEKTEFIRNTILSLIELNIFREENEEIKLLEQNLKTKLEYLNKSLLNNELINSNNLYFPVLEYNEGSKSKEGFLEFLNVKVHKANNIKEDVFYIIPSGEKIEKRLREQVHNSWTAAIKFVGTNFIKMGKHHEIFISFDKKYGEYIGNSLGLVLTIGFIGELLKLYQTRSLINVKSGIAITGGVNENGAVLPVKEEIISAKTRVAFYSTISSLVVPKEDEEYAVKKTIELNKVFPGRKLKIIGIESLEDLIDRRSVVEIKKTNLINYAAKKIYKHKYSVILLLMLVFVSGYFLGMNFDNNPDSLDIDDHLLSVKNKYGNILWQRKVGYSDDQPLTEFMKGRIARLFDVNNDGKKDLIITSELLNGTKDVGKFGRVACFDYKQRLLWQYVFRDTISTRVEKFTPFYSLHIFDIEKNLKDPEILLVGQHENYYPSPIIKLRLKDGKRIGGIFWHPGGGSQGFIGDYNGDGKDEIIATSISNGLERCVLYSIDYDKLKGTAPTTKNYRFIGKPVADFNQYIVLPKSDVNIYYKERYNTIGTPPFITYNNLIYFTLIENIYPDGSEITIGYEFDKQYKLRDIIIGDKFRVIRDSLVAEGKIKGPFTETPEYKKYLRDQIKYWDGREFIGIKAVQDNLAKGN